MKDELSKTAHRSSFVIWLNRHNEIMFKNPVPICDIPTNLHFRTVPDYSGITSFTIKDIYPPPVNQTNTPTSTTLVLDSETDLSTPYTINVNPSRLVQTTSSQFFVPPKAIFFIASNLASAFAPPH